MFNPGVLSVHKDFHLIGRHFIIDISLPENDNGIINLNRDPRKLRQKPDVYVGMVKEISPQCRIIKVGDKICIERWTYSQQDLDDQHIIADERDVLVLGEDEPAPGVVVMKLINPVIKTSLVLPQGTRPKKPTYYSGIVQCSSEPDINPGEILYIPRREDFQYRLGLDRLVFRVVDGDSILMKLIPEFKMEEVGNG